MSPGNVNAEGASMLACLRQSEHEPNLKLRQKGVDGPLFVKRSEHMGVKSEENKPADPRG